MTMTMKYIAISLTLLVTNGCYQSSHFNDQELLFAAESGNTNKIGSYLSKGGSINAILKFHRWQPFGLTLLHYAVWKGNFVTVRYLLAHGADPNQVDDQSGSGAIHYAGCIDPGKVPWNIRVSIISTLLEYGANINITNRNGATVLMEASMINDHDLVTWLLEHRADVSATNSSGFSALHFAENQEIAKILLANGANPFLITTSGESPLDVAIRNNRTDVVGVLTNRYPVANPDRRIQKQ